MSGNYVVGVDVGSSSARSVAIADKPLLSESYACPCPCPYANFTAFPKIVYGHGHGHAYERVISG